MKDTLSRIADGFIGVIIFLAVFLIWLWAERGRDPDDKD